MPPPLYYECDVCHIAVSGMDTLIGHKILRHSSVPLTLKMPSNDCCTQTEIDFQIVDLNTMGNPPNSQSSCQNLDMPSPSSQATIDVNNYYLSADPTFQVLENSRVTAVPKKKIVRRKRKQSVVKTKKNNSGGNNEIASISSYDSNAPSSSRAVMESDSDNLVIIPDSILQVEPMRIPASFTGEIEDPNSSSNNWIKSEAHDEMDTTQGDLELGEYFANQEEVKIVPDPENDIEPPPDGAVVYGQQINPCKPRPCLPSAKTTTSDSPMMSRSILQDALETKVGPNSTGAVKQELPGLPSKLASWKNPMSECSIQSSLIIMQDRNLQHQRYQCSQCNGNFAHRSSLCRHRRQCHPS